MLLEEGFRVVSVDASDKMLKYALKERWERRKEPAFDNWGEESQCAVMLNNSQMFFVDFCEMIIRLWIIFPSQSLKRLTGLR